MVVGARLGAVEWLMWPPPLSPPVVPLLNPSRGGRRGLFLSNVVSCWLLSWLTGSCPFCPKILLGTISPPVSPVAVETPLRRLGWSMLLQLLLFEYGDDEYFCVVDIFTEIFFEICTQKFRFIYDGMIRLKVKITTTVTYYSVRRSGKLGKEWPSCMCNRLPTKFFPHTAPVFSPSRSPTKCPYGTFRNS